MRNVKISVTRWMLICIPRFRVTVFRLAMVAKMVEEACNLVESRWWLAADQRGRESRSGRSFPELFAAAQIELHFIR